MSLRVVSAISLVYICRMLGLFMVLPVLLVLGESYHGATVASLGVALGIYGLTQATLQIPLGLVSDRLGRRPVLIAGLLVFAAGSVLAAASDTVEGLIIGRALQGAGAVSSTLLALLADLVPVQYRTRAMAVVGVSIGLSFSAAMIMGPMVANVWGLPGLFWLTSVLALVSIGLVTLLPTPERTVKDGSQRWRTRDATRVGRQRDLWPLNLGIFCLHSVLAMIFLRAPALFESHGLSLGQQGLVYLVMATLALGALGPMMAQSERHGNAKAMVLVAQGLLVSGVSLLWLAEQSLTYLLLSLLLFFVGFNFLEASLPSWLSRLAPVALRGTAMGVFSTGQFLGAAVGGAAGGLLLHAGGSTAVLSSALFLLVIWSMLTGWSPSPPLSRQRLLAADGADSTELERWATRVRRQPGVLEAHVLSDGGGIVLKIVHNEFDETAALAARER